MSLVISKESTLVASTAMKAVSKPAEPKDEPIIKPTNKADKLKAVASVAASMNKQYECKLIQKLGKGKAAARIPSLPTEMPTFDEDVSGCGGVPRGRIIEIYGPESAGKTAFCLHIIACAQKAGGLAAIVDAEHALMLGHARSIGVDIDELIISQPDYGEQALEVVDALAKTGAVDIIVVDSVSALVPKAELDGDMGDSHMGLQARLMSQAMRKLVGTASKSGTIIIFINQVRMKIGVVFGNPETTSGGNALKFYASQRYEVRRLSNTDGGQIKDGDTHIGHRMKIKNIKNKVGNPYRETIVDLMYANGFNTRLDTVEYLLEHGGIIIGDQTKEKEGNGVPKGWLGFEGENYRKGDLTSEPVWDTISLAAKKAIDDKVKAAAAGA
jgi:recombination protein RecA